MDRPIRSLPAVIVCITALLHGQDASVVRYDRYNDWAWGPGYELKNDLVSLGVLPDLGGRAIAFKLGTCNFLYHQEYDVDYPIPANPIMMQGGVMTWPTPQDNWSNPSWPPPWSLIQQPYTAMVRHESADSVTVELTSAVEQWGAPGLRYRKLYTVYKKNCRIAYFNGSVVLFECHPERSRRVTCA